MWYSLQEEHRRLAVCSQSFLFFYFFLSFPLLVAFGPICHMVCSGQYLHHLEVGLVQYVFPKLPSDLSPFDWLHGFQTSRYPPHCPVFVRRRVRKTSCRNRSARWIWNRLCSSNESRSARQAQSEASIRQTRKLCTWNCRTPEAPNYLLVLNAGNGWEWGEWDDYQWLLWIIPSFPTFSTSKTYSRTILLSGIPLVSFVGGCQWCVRPEMEMPRGTLVNGRGSTVGQQVNITP